MFLLRVGEPEGLGLKVGVSLCIRLTRPSLSRLPRGQLGLAYLRLIDSCITQLKAQGPSRTCNESKEEEEEEGLAVSGDTPPCKVTPVILHGVVSSDV